MENKSYKKKMRRFRRRLRMEALMKAGMLGLPTGLLAVTVVLLSGRIMVKELWTAEAVVAGGILCLLTTAICFLLFKPGKKEVLARIDSLGLQERMITMDEFRQTETVIARMQRQDAKEKLEHLKTGNLKLKLPMAPVLCCIAFFVVIALSLFLPLPEKEIDELAEKNVQEIQMMDELIAVLQELVSKAELTESHKDGLREIIEALAISFTPEDSTLMRTAKIATASKRLDLYEASGQNEVNILKQQADTSDGIKEKVRSARTEQIRLSRTVQTMKNLMGTMIDVLNMVEGSAWVPEVPSDSTYSEEELLPEEETGEEEEPPEGEEPSEGEEPAEDMEPGEEGESAEGEGTIVDIRTELIYDPERGEVSYGMVFDEYYQALLKALTEQEYSEDIRKMIEDYANSLE